MLTPQVLLLGHIFVDKELGESGSARLSSKFRTAQSNPFQPGRLSSQPIIFQQTTLRIERKKSKPDDRVLKSS